MMCKKIADHIPYGFWAEPLAPKATSVPLAILTSFGSSIYVSCVGTDGVLSQGLSPRPLPQSLAQYEGPLGWKVCCKSGPISSNILYKMPRIYTRHSLEKSSLKEQFIDLADD